jgi:hypothetical protein
MGFFDFLQSKSENDNKRLEDFLLPDSMQKNMYAGITKIRAINNAAGDIPSLEERALMISAIKSLYDDGKKITSYLEEHGVRGLTTKSEILVTAFYFSIDLGLKDAKNCNDNEIKEIFSLVSFGSVGVALKKEMIPNEIVSKIKEVINWLIAHPTE